MASAHGIPHHHTNRPARLKHQRWKNLRTAAAAAAGSAASNSGKNIGAKAASEAAASTSAQGGLMGWWNGVTQNLGPRLQSNVHKMSTRASKIKWGMPVDVKVDIFRPTYEFITETSSQLWDQLPPQVQRAAPYVGAASVGGLFVGLIQGKRLSNERQRRQDADARIQVLKLEVQDLLKRINLLKARSGGPRSDVEVKMAAAVAEATNAAAAAADAAARAATACIFRLPQYQQQPRNSNNNSSNNSGSNSVAGNHHSSQPNSSGGTPSMPPNF